MRDFRGLVAGLILVALAGINWNQPCSMPAPSEFSVGCVNEKNTVMSVAI